MINLTANEIAVLEVMIKYSIEECGDFSQEQNLSYTQPGELMQRLEMTFQQVGGILSSLSAKGMAVDCGEKIVNGVSTTTGTSDWVAIPHPQTLEIAQPLIEAWC